MAARFLKRPIAPAKKLAEPSFSDFGCPSRRRDRLEPRHGISPAQSAHCGRSNGCDTVLRGLWEADPRGLYGDRSERCRAIRWRSQRERATEARKPEIRVLLEAALRRLDDR